MEQRDAGTAKTAIIICCSPFLDNAAETLSSLRFGCRSKSIQNAVQVRAAHAGDPMRCARGHCRPQQRREATNRPIGRLRAACLCLPDQVNATRTPLEQLTRQLAQVTSDKEELQGELAAARAELEALRRQRPAPPPRGGGAAESGGAVAKQAALGGSRQALCVAAVQAASFLLFCRLDAAIV